jgi:hypothetical protein
MKVFGITLIGMCSMCLLASLPVGLGVASAVVFCKVSNSRKVVK